MNSDYYKENKISVYFLLRNSSKKPSHALFWCLFPSSFRYLGILMGVTCFVKLQSFLFRGGIFSPSTFVKAHIFQTQPIWEMIPICTLLSAKLENGCLPIKLNTHNLQNFLFSKLTCYRKFLHNRTAESFQLMEVVEYCRF